MQQYDVPPPRIGYVLKMYPRFSETFILSEILALQDLGADVEIFSLRAPVDGRFHEALAEVRASVTYVPCPVKSTDLWKILNQGQTTFGSRIAEHLSELLAASPSDAVQAIDLACRAVDRGISHLHAHFGSISTTVARLAARLADITYSCTLHAKDIYHEEVDHDDLERKLSDAAAVVTVSDYNLGFLRENYGVGAKRVTRIYNGLDLGGFSASRPRERPPVVVGVGRLVEKKGFHHLIDAIGLLRSQGRLVRLELIGAGTEEAALRSRAEGLGLTEAISFLGPLTQEETRGRIRQAAALAAPCIVGTDGNRDGLPTVILEGLALGTPVVATPVTGIPEAVLDERTGLLVAEGDARALADALARLIDDADLRCSLADAGRRHVEDNFDSRANAKMLYELFCDIARHAGPVKH